MGSHCYCYKQRMKKGLWSPDEDKKLVKHILNHGHGCWSSVPKLAGLLRCGKSCRLRWMNYLRPDVKRGAFSHQEEKLIIELHSVLGNRWSQIAAQLPGRTDNEIKNLWNSCIKKNLRQRIHEDKVPTNNEKTSTSNKEVANDGFMVDNSSLSENSATKTKEFFSDHFVAAGKETALLRQLGNTTSSSDTRTRLRTQHKSRAPIG